MLEDLGTVPRPTSGSQFTYNDIDADHVAFVFTLSNAQDSSRRWTLYLWDRHAHTMARVAQNPIDKSGNPLPSGWVNPQLTRDYLYWIEAAPDATGWGGSRLMQYSFVNHATRVMYSGLTEAFVPYGDIVLFTALRPGTPPPSGAASGGPPEIVEALEQASGQPAAVPAGITAGSDNANEMRTQGDLVVWSTALGGIRAWRPAWGRSLDLVSGLENPSPLRLAGPYLVWNNTVLDLRTNSRAAFPDDGSIGGSAGTRVSVWAYTSATSYDRARQLVRGSQYVLDLASLPALKACSH